MLWLWLVLMLCFGALLVLFVCFAVCFGCSRDACVVLAVVGICV